MKRANIKQRPLADTVLKALEPEASTYRELHESGVYFQVKPTGAKSWLFRYKRPDGRWNWLGIGAYPEVGGAKARELAADERKRVAQGIDPVEYRKAQAQPQLEEPPALVNPRYRATVCLQCCPKGARLASSNIQLCHRQGVHPRQPGLGVE